MNIFKPILEKSVSKLLGRLFDVLTLVFLLSLPIGK